jgi:hypothetical protein
MLLVFGLTSTMRLLGTRPRGCQRCGNHSNHEVVESSRRFSLFFVPLFRVGAAQYLDLCGVCGLATPLSESEARSVGSERVPSTPQDAPTWGPQDR